MEWLLKIGEYFVDAAAEPIGVLRLHAKEGTIFTQATIEISNRIVKQTGAIVCNIVPASTRAE